MHREYSRSDLLLLAWRCARLQNLFADVRSFAHFKLLHLGLITELPRKSLPAHIKDDERDADGRCAIANNVLLRERLLDRVAIVTGSSG